MSGEALMKSLQWILQANCGIETSVFKSENTGSRRSRAKVKDVAPADASATAASPASASPGETPLRESIAVRVVAV